MWEIYTSSFGGIFVLGTSSEVALPDGTLKIGEWQFVAFTFDGTMGALYSASSDSTGITMSVDTGTFTFGQGVDSTIWIGTAAMRRQQMYG